MVRKTKMKIMVRKAKIQDVPAIRELISFYSQRGDMLPKALMEIYEELRDFFVFVDGGDKVLGCCALHLFWEDLAEIRSLAVGEKNERQGIGSSLVNACMQEARSLGISKVFTLTKKPIFFQKQGLKRLTGRSFRIRYGQPA